MVNVESPSWFDTDFGQIQFEYEYVSFSLQLPDFQLVKSLSMSYLKSSWPKGPRKTRFFFFDILNIICGQDLQTVGHFEDNLWTRFFLNFV